jgi:hypothetical protein
MQLAAGHAPVRVGAIGSNSGYKAPVARVAPLSTSPCVAPCAFRRTADHAALRLATALRAVRADQAAEQMDASMVQLIANITKDVDVKLAVTLKANADAAKGVDVATDSELRRKVVTSINRLQAGLLERETEVQGCFAAWKAFESGHWAGQLVASTSGRAVVWEPSASLMGRPVVRGLVGRPRAP